MASKEALAKQVCLDTVPELHLDSRVSLSCLVGSNHLVKDGSVTQATCISSYSYQYTIVCH